MNTNVFGDVLDTPASAGVNSFGDKISGGGEMNAFGDPVESPVSNANETPINPDLLRGVPMPGAPVDYITAAKLAWATEGKPPSGFLRSDEEILADKIAKASLTGEEMKALSLSDFPAAALEGLGVSPGIATELGTQAFGPAAFGLQKKKLPAWAAPIERGGVAGLGGLADPANSPYLAGGLLSQAVGRILGAVFLGQGTTGAVSDVGQGTGELIKGNTEKGLEDISRGGTIAATFYGPGAVSKLRKGGELHGQEKGQESRQENVPLTRPTEIQPVEGKLPLTPPAEVPKTFVPEPVPQPSIQDVLAKPGAVPFETAAALSGIPKPRTPQETIADALDLKPEPSWPGLPGWGFSPKNTTEVGTFYVPEGASVEQVRAARDAKFELFKQENQKHEQTKAAAARTEVPAASESVPEAVPTEREAAGQAVEAKVTPESTGLSVDDQAFALLHDLKGVATIAKGNAEKGVAKLTQEQGLDFQAEGDKIYEDYLASGDYQAADAAVRALKDRVVAATKETPTAPIPQAVAGEPTPKEAKTIDVLSKTKPEYINEDQAARLKALRSKFPGYVPKEIESPELSAGKRVGLPHEEAALKDLGIEQGTLAHDALQRLASRPDVYGKQNAALADFLTRHFAPMLRMVTIDPRGVSDRGRPSFLPHAEGNLLGEVRLGVGAEKQSGFTIPERLLHEGAHAATWWSFEHPTTEAARSARLKMEQLLEESKKRWQPTGNRDLDYQMRYYHQNPHEFIAGIFNSWEMRDHLNSFKLGERSAWEQIKDVVKTLLGVKPGTALDQAFDALIESQSEPAENVRSAYPKEYLEAPAPGDPLPFRFKTYAEEKADVQARGIGKVPLIGKLFDPRAKRTLPEEKVILTNSISKQKADSAIALWLETKKGEPRPFVPDEQGRIEFLNGTHGYMSDAIEAELRVPGSQSLTPKQRAFVRDWKERRDEAIAYAQSEGVKFFFDSDGNPRVLDEGYFPRPRIGTRGEPATPKGIGVGARPGSKQGPMKERYYDTEAEGAKAGVLYEPDPYLREAGWLRAVYRSIADARLAKDSELKGRAGIRLVPARDEVTGVQIPGAFQIVGKGPRYGESEVYGVPALKGRVFPVDIAKKLSEFYTSQPNKYARFAANVNDTLKGFKFAADVSAPLNQGLPLMSYNPKAWANATVWSYAAFLEALIKGDSSMSKRYLERPNKLRIAQTMVENGSSLFQLQDFLTGTQKKHFATEFPIPVIGGVLRQTLGRAVRAGGESMGTFLSIAKIEAFEALEPLAKKNGTSMADLTEIVDNLVLSGRMEQIGVGQGRALTERLIFNAPSYLRAFANAAANAVQGGMEGSVARRSIIGLLTSVSLQAYLAYKLSGMSEDEIKERMTPGSSKFLRFQYRIDKEKSVELSYGNIFLSFTRLLGDTWEIATGKKSLRPGAEGNPWLRWLSYRKSPVVDLVQQVYSGRDYRGMPSGVLESLGRSVAPIPLEPVANVVAGTESRKQGAIEFGTQFLGGNAYPKNSRSMDEIARDKFGRPISQLNARERLAVAKERASTSKPSLDEQQMIEKAASEREFENRRKIVARLPKEQRDFIEKYSLSVPGFQASYEKNRLQMPITPEERDLHLAAVQREYQVAIARLMSSGRVEQFAKDGTLQRRLNVVLTDARERAMKDLKREVRRPR